MSALLSNLGFAFLITTALATPTLLAQDATPKFKPEKAVKDADFDRLDGMGKTKIAVDVIHWVNRDDDGNATSEQMEIHVKPAGSLAGLATKIDDKNPALVIGYRFKRDAMTQLIRRAALTMKLQAGYKIYQDTSTDGTYDSLILTNNELKGKSYKPFRPDPEPTQLYPSGHPMSGIAIEEDAPTKTQNGNQIQPETAPPGKKADTRKPSSYDEDSGEIKGGFGL